MESEGSETAPESVTSSADVDKEQVESGEKTKSSEEGSGAVSLDRTDSLSSEPPKTPSISGKDRDKINILLKPVGDAPILKNKLWAVPSDRLVSQITEFVKKYLKLEKNQNLFFFVNQLFAPSPDQCLRDLYECFGSDGKLVLHYSTTVAWG